MARHVVAKAVDLPPGARLRVVVEGRPILVLNINGELDAISRKWRELPLENMPVF